GGHVYGALDDYKSFSKQMVIERILRGHGLGGHELLGFGDGFVEVEEVKKVGGVAVAVASDEVRRQGVNGWKRDRLVRAGADVVKLGPDSMEQPGVPRGKVTMHTWTIHVFPGTVRDYWVYVPAQYDPGRPACVMVFQDGAAYVDPSGDFRVPTVFDNLIHKKK